MIKRNNKIFLDTSVIFAAVLSKTGGARKLFRLGEAGMLQLVIGPNVLRECEEVVLRKAPTSLPKLAYLLETCMVVVSNEPPEQFLEQARAIVEYEPDAYVLAEAMSFKPDWFITHDKKHFLKDHRNSELAFLIGTPGDLIQTLEDEFKIS